MKKKIKIVHIHTDYKFIYNSDLFTGDTFENEIIFIDKGQPSTNKVQGNYFILRDNDLKNILRYCYGADLVVLYGLDDLKSRVALRIPKNIKIAWRFFGYELYMKKKDLFLSPQSLEFVGMKKSVKFKLQKIVLNPHYILKKAYEAYNQVNQVFYKAIKRIDYMFVLSKEEYDFLSQYWELPKYLNFPPIKRMPFNNSSQLLKVKQNNKPTVVVGNNRSIYNNHLDVIDIVEASTHKVDYNFIILFNYGSKETYAKKVIDKVKGKSYYTLVDKFIQPKEFKEFYMTINALVINGYRQMAGANIFMALQSGVKVYLNPKNVFMKWLKNNGFKIFSIENLENDLNNNNLILDSKTAHHNLNTLSKFNNLNSKDLFQKLLIKTLKP